MSNISVASGIYEEIIENEENSRNARLHSNIYEVPEELVFGHLVATQHPPPLPPRKRCGSGSTRNGSLSDDGLDSEGGTRSATPCTQDDSSTTPEEKFSGNQEPIENSDYVPMSPRLKDIALHQLQKEKHTQEEVYMVMR